MTTSGPHNPNDPYEPMPAAPPVDPGVTPTAARPRMVTIAFWLWIAVSAVLLLSMIAAFGLDRGAVEDALRRSDTGLSGETLTRAADVFIVVAIAFPAVFLVAFLGGAFPMRAGRNWARILLTVFGGLLILLTLLGTSGANPVISIAIVALIGAAIVLMYLRDSAAYFSPARR